MAEKFLNQTGLQIYNDALQAKIAENYATKEYVSNLVGTNGMKYEVVDSLPESPNTSTIYLLSNASENSENIYDEYMWINEAWEFIGNTQTDLSQYATQQEIENINTELNTINSELTRIETNTEVDINSINENITNLTEQLSDLRDSINVGGVNGLENPTVSIDDTKLEVGSEESPAQLKADGKTFEVLTNGEATVKADGEKLFANNIKTNGYLEAGAHRQQIFEINGETRTGWFYTGGGE